MLKPGGFLMRLLGKRLISISILAGLFVLSVGQGFAQARILELEAISGEPFGVGRLVVQLSKQALPEILGADGLGLSERDGRVLYPALKRPIDNTIVTDLLLQSPLMSGGPVREGVGGLLRDLLSEPSPRTTLYFLFRGDEPFELTIQARRAQTVRVRPRNNPPAHGQLLQAWWREYTAEPSGLFQKKRADCPPLVEGYLKSMLARRLGLALPEKPEAESWQAQLREQLGLFLGTEDVRVAIMRDRVLGLSVGNEAADVPMPELEEVEELPLPEPEAVEELPPPKPEEAPKRPLPNPAAEVQVEPIAMRVPAECLYIRFGSYSNFLWMQDTLEKWGGDLGNLVALRGLDHEMAKRMERQLVVKQTALSRMLGGTLISDVAMIGTDMFMREGAAYGLLFEARSSMLLDADLRRQRSERLKEDKLVTEMAVTIAGQKVSLLAAPGGAVRSYYAVDNGYIFITTSKTLMRRFLETGSGKGALGASKAFRYTRSVMPLERDDTVFVYLSDVFFRNMASAPYWIEMRRRLRAVADIEAVQLAMLASAAEGAPGETIAELVDGRFLPESFGRRGDGSKAVVQEDGEVVDSIRGRRGMFLPIPDVPIEAITPDEADAYQKFVEFQQSKWGRIDPMIVGIRREELSGNRERIVLDVQANPFAKKHVEMLSQFIGPANARQLAPIPGDMMAAEVVLSNQLLFGGIRDVGTPFEVVGERVVPAGGLLNAIVGYVGTTGRLGFLSLLNLGIPPGADASGFARGRGPMCRYQNERFTVFSFQREVLAAVCPQLRFVQAERPAQLRLRVDDLSAARLTPMLNTMGFLRTRQTSLGNIRLMHALAQQLHVPGGDCKAAAELLLDAKLICPLGGEYAYQPTGDGLGRWTSTALGQGGNQSFLNVQVPQGYQAPPLNWFRGLVLDATMTDNTLSAHAEIVMQLPEPSLE
jgi:hypothetical protein